MSKVVELRGAIASHCWQPDSRPVGRPRLIRYTIPLGVPSLLYGCASCRYPSSSRTCTAEDNADAHAAQEPLHKRSLSGRVPDEASPQRAIPARENPSTARALSAGLVLTVGMICAAYGAAPATAPHVHGRGTLDFIREGSRLEVHFETPVFNLTGFDYAPATAAEKQVWTRAVTTVRAQGRRLLRPNASARCTLAGVYLEDPFAAGHSRHEQRDTPEHSPDEPASDEHEALPGDRGEAVTHDHANLHVRYRFDCERADRLREVWVELFEVIPGLEELDAIYLDHRRQTAARLTADKVRFRFE